MAITTEFEDFAGSMLHVKQRTIDEAGYTCHDNPICNIFKRHVHSSIDVYFNPFEDRLEFRDPRLSYTQYIHTTSNLEDWINDYLENETASEISVCIYRHDEEEVEEATGVTMEEDEDFVIERMQDLHVGIADGPYALGGQE